MNIASSVLFKAEAPPLEIIYPRETAAFAVKPSSLNASKNIFCDARLDVV